jgi:hypothetical protein
MARFPDSPGPQTPFSWRLSLPMARGGNAWTQRTRALTRGPLYSCELTYRALSWTDVQALLAFWTEHQNGIFTFVDFNGYSKGGTSPGVAWPDLYVGKGDGSELSFNLPTFGLKASPAPVLKVAGTTKSVGIESGGTDANILLGDGTDGVDLLVFEAGHAPAANAIVTISATCRRALPQARFGSDDFPFGTTNPNALQGGTLQILEVR